MIKYIGSKRRLVRQITEIADRLPGVTTVLDLYSGTSRVGHALKRKGYRVFSNDHTSYAHTLARCYIEGDLGSAEEGIAREAIQMLARLEGQAGFITKNYCEDAMFFSKKNGQKIDAIRRGISNLKLDPIPQAIVLTSLLEAADRVDSTVGLQNAYLKQPAPRSKKALELRMPELLPQSKHGKGRAFCYDAKDLLSIPNFVGGTDVCYLDPPYNQHKYMNNYHIWETIVRDDNPKTYGVVNKREDCRSYSSLHNSKRYAFSALEGVLDLAQQFPYTILSYNNSGFVGLKDIQDLFSTLYKKGSAFFLKVPITQYIGHNIGVHNPKGEAVGKKGNPFSTEYIFVGSRLPINLESFHVVGDPVVLV